MLFLICPRHFSLVLQAMAQERLGGYRLHVEQAREEIEALQVSKLIHLRVQRQPCWVMESPVRSTEPRHAP